MTTIHCKTTKKGKANIVKNRKLFKLLQFINEHNQYDTDSSLDDINSVDESPKNESVQTPMTIGKEQPADLELKNCNGNDGSREDCNVVEDEDVEMLMTLPINNHREDASSPSYHYGLAIAKDVFELAEDFKIDAKLEIMQIISKYQKRQLHRTQKKAPGHYV